MNDLISLMVSSTVFTIGIIMIYGAIKSWKFLIDPPESLWPFYSQSFIKKFFGKKFLFYETIIVGALLIIAGLYYLILSFN